MNFIDNWPRIAKELEEKEMDSSRIYDGVLLKVWKDEVRLPNGNTSEREYIRHPGASVVLPVFENGDIMLVGQYRYPLRQALLEVPAGKLDPGEPPGQAARRELTEETGLICNEMVRIGQFHPCIGYSDEVIHLYAAWGLTQQEQATDEDEFLSRHRLHISEAFELINSGTITDSKTIISLFRTRAWWEKHVPFPVHFELN